MISRQHLTLSIENIFLWPLNTMDYLANIFAFSKKALFNGTVSAVRHNNELSYWFDVSSGIGLSPSLVS